MSDRLPNAHSFIQLSVGNCHYRVDGPAAGKTLLLLHGATVPLWQFDRLAPLLNREGICTVRLDLYGHGYSDRPGAVHDYTLFTRQVFELLDSLELSGEIDILGHSLGAAIAARLLLADPDRFGALVMAAPMLNYLDANRAARLLRVPLLGEWLIDHYVLPMLVRRRARRYRNIEDGRFVAMFRDQFRVPGFGRSLLSLMRSDALADQRSCYAALNTLANPVLLLGGAGDQIATPAHMRVLGDLLPRAQRHIINGAEHALILTHPEQVASQVKRFLEVRERPVLCRGKP
jgi:pimeloyl-ACP methyl ester carboxylesterase